MTSDYVVVPREATEEMCLAGIEASPMFPFPELRRDSGRVSLDTDQCAGLFAAMVSAAPSPWKPISQPPVRIGGVYLVARETPTGPVTSEAVWSQGWWLGRGFTVKPGDGGLLGWMDLPAPPSNPT